MSKPLPRAAVDDDAVRVSAIFKAPQNAAEEGENFCDQRAPVSAHAGVPTLLLSSCEFRTAPRTFAGQFSEKDTFGVARNRFPANCVDRWCVDNRLRLLGGLREPKEQYTCSTLPSGSLTFIRAAARVCASLPDSGDEGNITWRSLPRAPFDLEQGALRVTSEMAKRPATTRPARVSCTHTRTRDTCDKILSLVRLPACHKRKLRRARVSTTIK